MGRVLMSDKFLILVQHGQGFVCVKDSTNNREVAFRITSARAAQAHKKYKKNVVPTYYIFEKIGMQKVEIKEKAKKKTRLTGSRPPVIIICDDLGDNDAS